MLAYRHDNEDFLPQEGTYWKWNARGVWYNELPPYLDMPAYMDIEGANEQIKEAPKLSTWICPSKNLTRAYKSGTGKNQFDYAMNQVLDGLGKEPDGSADMPGFPDQKSAHTPAHLYDREPYTVFMFDIEENSMAGTPRKVANMYQRNYKGKRVGKFHGDFANVLYISGGVGHCVVDDLVTDRDFEHGEVVWNAQHLYWGYPPRGR